MFDDGRALFEKGDYPAALAAFESAARAGLTGPAIQFNIGVAAFRAGDYARAEEAFAEAASTPSMAPLAHYNLGLVATKRGDLDGARRWFTRAEQEATDDNLRQLAASRLDALPPPPQRNWVGYASLGAGYDDNVALLSSSDVLGVTGIDDAFLELQLAISAPLGEPWRLDAGMVYLDYQELDEFDQLGAYGGGRYRLEVGDWLNELIGQLAYTTLDGEGFENRKILTLQTTRDLSATWRLRAQYRYSDIDGMNQFSGITGDSHEAGVRVSGTSNGWELQLGYRFETDDHEDENLSATRNELAFGARRSLATNWALAFDATLRDSEYDIEANGSETLAELAVAVERTISERWRLVLRYAYTNNDADRPEFDYERNRIAALIEAFL